MLTGGKEISQLWVYSVSKFFVFLFNSCVSLRAYEADCLRSMVKSVGITSGTYMSVDEIKAQVCVPMSIRECTDLGSRWYGMSDVSHVTSMLI